MTGARTGGTSSDLPLRSRMRHEVLPVLGDVLGPGVPEALARSADLLRDDADALDAIAAEALDRALDRPQDRTQDGAQGRARAPGDGTLPVLALVVAELLPLLRAVRRRALRAAAVDAGALPGSLSAAHVDALDALVVDWRGQGAVHLPGGVRAQRRCGRLVFAA
ncbi:TilS substrate-binding domain-containing protein [Paraoerskovia sediminicola]|uniref:TilS substrate-binding domain-containing protein n=1 Tax=Paraoerskovia sediminicola TaxID=1138587 RepID=UPI003D9B6136